MATLKEKSLDKVFGGITQDTTIDNIERYKRVFYQYSSKNINGERYLTKDDFIDAIAPKEDTNIKREQYGILFNMADTRKRGLLSFTDFVVFEDLLAKPDAEYIIAFKLFDLDNSGKVSVEEFRKVLSANWDPESVPFDFDSEWLRMYTGGRGEKEIQFDAFCQLLKGLQAERIRQSFKFYDKKNEGYISPYAFKLIVKQIAKYKLSDYVIEHSPTLANLFAGSNVSYANVIAFHNVIRQLDLVESIVDQCFKVSKTNILTRADFMNVAAQSARFTLFTPMEVDIIFHFAGLNNTSGKLTRADFDRLFDPTWKPKPPVQPQESSEVQNDKSSIGWEALKSAYNFVLGSIAGAVGATVVYPIDLVKTRMQNQRSAVVGQVMYKNSMDCFQKVIKNEGVIGLYRGLGPQLIGVAPEKAIKLTMNDLVRNIFTNKETGTIPLWAEILAGSTAGASQVVFTNPLEIVKIRLQVQGELSKTMNGPPKQSAVQIVRQLGLLGLYKGVGACLLRDVPFSAIYFTAYSHLKKDYFLESPTKKLTIPELLTAGAIAGMPAAYLTTPADVIKTRLQVEARKGQTTYTGIIHAARTILKEEGFSAFFKGGPARIFRSSPQFGCTLAVYEFLQSSFPLSRAEGSMSRVVEKVIITQNTADLQSLKSRQAMKLLLSLDYKFGLIPPVKA